MLASPFRQLSTNLALSAAVLAVGLAGLEVASRYLFPIAPGARFEDADGRYVHIYADAVNFTHGLRFVQVSADYREWAQITPEGYRAPAVSGSPDVVFLGDSFTFGQGLPDDATFAAIYCAKAKLACANLGRPGTGTNAQVRILEHFLSGYGWKPREVKLFILAYSGGLAAGNDFVDTPFERNPPVEGAPPGGGVAAQDVGGATPWQWVVGRRQWLLAHFNLARIAHQQFGNALRSAMLRQPEPEQLQAGIDAVAAELGRLRALSERDGFAVTVYVVHPVQDLLRRTYGETLAAVQAAAGPWPVIDTAPAHLDRAADFYFPYDGHWNAAGAARMAEFLLAESPAAGR